ncbi:Ank 2 domain containing protein, partial [Asbolus verrucosus]
MEDASETSMNRIWDILLKNFAAFSTTWSTQFFIDALDEMWTKPVPGIYISDFMKKIDIPISAQTEHFRRPNVSLKQFLTNDDRLLKIISFNQILQLLDDKLVIGDDCKKNIPKYYVPRHIPKILLNAKAIDEIENDLFIFVYKSINKSAHLRFKKKTIDLEKYLLLKKKKNIDISVSCTDQFFSSFSDNLVILARYTCTEEQFQEVCSINQFKNCHHVKMIDDETIEWIQSRGSIRRLRQYQLDFEDFKTDQFVQDVDVLYHFNNKVNMIVANPGMGKTVTTEVLKSICPSSHWVITISLNYHAKFFEVNHSNTEVLQYFLNIENKHYLAGEAAKVFFSNKKVLFLWDSFDELPRNCVESVISTIKNLSSDGYLQWIFTRHSSKEFLEDTFDVFALTLTQFSPQNQHDYIYNHLKEKYEDEEKIQNIIYKINEINSLTSNYLDYSGTPLHIHMMVQIFINNLQIQTDKITTVTGMYQEFIQGKFDCMFKKAEADLENYHMQQIQEQFKRAQLSLYKIASLKASFDEEIFATLSLNCNQLLEELSESEDGLGLIIGVNDYQKPVFVHKSYEEFLTALWLSENHRKHQDLITTWFQERYTNIRLMFDMLLAQNSPPHLAVLHRNLNTLEKVKDDIANCKDIAGRTALHVAAAWGRRHPLIKTAKKANSRVVEEDEVCLTILKFLLEHNSNPLDKDQMLQLDSFQYADETLSLAAIDLMLTAKRIDMQRLKNCNHIPTLLHYAVKFSYNSILESIDDIPYIEYKHKRGKVTFLQHAAEANNVQ